MESKNLELGQNTFDYRSLIRPYLKNWPWFFISIVLALALAYLYIRYTVPKYAVQANIHILEDESASSELGAFKDLEILTGGSSQVFEDEVQILNSRSNHIEVVKRLGLNTSMKELGNIKNTQLYKNEPFNLNFIAPDSVINDSSFEFFVQTTSDTSFEFSTEEQPEPKVYSYGEDINTPLGNIVLTPNLDLIGNQFDKNYQITINPLSTIAENYQTKTFIVNNGDKSNIANISMDDAIPIRAKDYINTLIQVYNKNGVEDKKTIADKTSEFINERIKTISESLSSVDSSAQEFKADRGIVDLQSEAGINLNIGASNQQELQNARVQMSIAQSMRDIVNTEDGAYDPLPANIGLSDPSIATTTARYNELALERKRLLKSSNEKNPIIVNLDQQLDGLKSSLSSSLSGMTNNLGLTVSSLSRQQSRINSKIYSAPKDERALRDITRKQQTTEGLYLYLLQKREESQITYASATPKSKVIDAAYNSPLPVSPKKPIIYLAGLVLGLLIPFSIIYGLDMFDNKVNNKMGLESILPSDVPILAELPKITGRSKKFVLENDRSVLAESLRILRTNIDYLIKSNNSHGKGNVIYVTSSVPGEGKTFVSSNLSMILASTNKKVLLIGADIRNPKITSFFTTGKNVNVLGKKEKLTKRKSGLTDYLHDSSLGLKDIVSPLLVYSNEIDVIYSGKIPPNPAELLMSDRLKELITEASQKYDYVIVDTAPMLVVTDTLLISENANHILYVVRAGVTEKKILDYPIKLKNENKLKGLAFVINDVKKDDLNYGGKYGYGYTAATKKWWQRK